MRSYSRPNDFSSFDMHDPIFDAHGIALSVEVATTQEIYNLDPAQTSARSEGQAFVVRSAGLTCARQHENASGAVLLRVRPEGPGRIRVRLRAKAPDTIRWTKLSLRGLPAPLAWIEESGLRPIGPLGEILVYPNGLEAPLICLRTGEDTLGVRVEDPRGRAMRFAAALEHVGPRAGQGVLEVICEEDVTHPSREFEAPPCVIARGVGRETLLHEYLAFVRDLPTRMRPGER